MHFLVSQQTLHHIPCLWLSLTWRQSLLPNMGLFRFGFKLIIIILQRNANFVHRQDATNYKMQGSDLRVVGGVGEMHCSLKSMIVYACILSSSSFYLSLTGHAVHAVEKYRAMAELTLSLQIDLVLNGMAATSEP